MKVSVIIPSYNHKNYVEHSIASVMNQTYKDIKLLVVDDGSKDGSVEKLLSLKEKYEFELILKENEGVCKTLNLGIGKVDSDLITFLASDDVMPLNRITEQVDIMKSNPDVDVLVGAVQTIDEKGNELFTKPVPDNYYHSFLENIPRCKIKAPTAMFRKRTFENYGLYNENLIIEDYEMWLRILSQGGKIYSCNKVWAEYRISFSDFAKRFERYYQGSLATLKLFEDKDISNRKLERFHQIYLIKKMLLGGRLYEQYDLSVLVRMPFWFRFFIYTFSRLPECIRHKTLKIIIFRF